MRRHCRANGPDSHHAQKALVAVAHEMLENIWYMLTRNKPYNHPNEALTRRKMANAGRLANRDVVQGAPERPGSGVFRHDVNAVAGYNDAFRKEHVPKNFLHKPSKHVREIHLRNEKANNNIQERLNGEFRDREKVARGLKKEDSPIIEGSKICHNFIRPYMGLDGGTPVDRTRITIRGDNKWETIIENASFRQLTRKSSSR